MAELICTVRGCGLALRAPSPHSLRCPRGHGFDRARAGYWNLLQPQDRRSREPGDSDEATAARERWLERGFADPLVELLARVAGVAQLAASSTVLDVGCGDGWFAWRLFGDRGPELCGVDLSRRALRRAARRPVRGTWILANADRGLPLATRSVDLALSIHGRRSVAELTRVLHPGARLVVALPGPDDLGELRELAQGSAVRRDRAAAAIAELAPGFVLRERASSQRRVVHDRAALEDALSMAYRGARAAERERVRETEALEVTLATEVLAFEPRGP